MLPHIETRGEALAAVQATRYPQVPDSSDREPAGLRGTSYGFAARAWGLPGREYAKRADVWPHDANGELLLVLQIESVRGVQNIDAILSVPGIGAIFVGPADLRMSLGVLETAPELETAIQTVLAATRAKGIPCGITAKWATVKQRMAEGFQLITLGDDSGLSHSAGQALRVARRALRRDD